MTRVNTQSRFIEMSSSWQKQGAIRDLVDDRITRASKRFTPSDIIQYVDISSVDSESNHVVSTTEYMLSDAPSRAQQCTEYGDILVSTVRPNLKNIAINQIVGDNTVASTGFCVLRPRTGYQGLLLAYVLSEPFTKKMVAEAKGSNYPAIHDSDVLNYPITIPEEREIDKIDSFILQADKSKFNGFKSRFIEMFREGSYQSVPLGDLCTKITDGSHNPPKGIDVSEYMMISSQNVFSDGLDLSDVRYLSKEDYENENKRTSITKGDVLLTIVGTIGRVYLITGAEGPITLQRSVAVLRPNDKITSRFLMVSFLFDDDFSKEGRGNAQKGVYLKQLSQYLIKLPSLEKQREFEGIYQQADKSKYLS